MDNADDFSEIHVRREVEFIMREKPAPEIIMFPTVKERELFASYKKVMGIMGTDSGYKLGDKVSILKNTVRTGEKEIDSVRQELNLALGKFYGGLSGMEKVVKLQHAVAADADENLEAVVKRYGNTNDEIVMLNDEVKSTKAVYADAVAIQGEKRVAYEQALQQKKTFTEKI